MEALIFLMGQTIGVPPPPENSEGTIGSHSEILSAIESRVRARGLWHKAQLQVSRALYINSLEYILHTWPELETSPQANDGL
jgi:hypothetical protein